MFSCKHVKIRFGKLPSESYTKLDFYSEKGFVFEPLEEKDGYVWGLYFAPVEESVQIDDISEAFILSGYVYRTSFTATEKQPPQSLTDSLRNWKQS